MFSGDFLGQGMVAEVNAPSPGEYSQEAVADGPLFRRSGWAAMPVCILIGPASAPTLEGDGVVGTTQRRVRETMARQGKGVGEGEGVGVRRAAHSGSRGGRF